MTRRPVLWAKGGEAAGAVSSGFCAVVLLKWLTSLPPSKPQRNKTLADLSDGQSQPPKSFATK